MGLVPCFLLLSFQGLGDIPGGIKKKKRKKKKEKKRKKKKKPLARERERERKIQDQRQRKKGDKRNNCPLLIKPDMPSNQKKKETPKSQTLVVSCLYLIVGEKTQKEQKRGGRSCPQKDKTYPGRYFLAIFFFFVWDLQIKEKKKSALLTKKVRLLRWFLFSSLVFR